MSDKSSNGVTSQMTISHFWHAIEKGQYHRCRQILKYHKKRNTSSQLLTLNEKISLQLLFQSFKEFQDAHISEFTEIAIALIDVGADVNQYVNPEDEDNLTLLHFIFQYEFSMTELLEPLLKNGANINVQTLLNNKPHYTALHYAVVTVDLKAVRLLLEYGADPNIPDMFGQTVLMHAALTENSEIFSCLLDYDVDVNFHVENGPIALEHALCSDRKDIFNVLWRLTDIELINERLEDILDTMISCMWYKPDKITCFYTVLDTPGIILPPNFRIIHRLAVELTKMDEKFEDEIVEKQLIKREFLKIEVYGIVKKLLEKGVYIYGKDFEGLIYLCHQYQKYKKPQRRLKLLNLLKDKNIEIPPSVIYFAVVNYPDFCTVLLKFCTKCNPISVFAYTIISNRLPDVKVLMLIKDLLKVCNPPGYLKLTCAKRIKFLLKSQTCVIRNDIHSPDKLTTPLHKMLPNKQKLDKQLANEVYQTLVIYSYSVYKICFIRNICSDIVNIITTENIVYNLIWVPIFKMSSFCKSLLNKK